MRTRTLRSSSKSIPTESTSSSKSEKTRKRIKSGEKLKGCAKPNITDNSSSKKQDVTSDSENESVDELTNNGQDPYPHCSNCNRTFKTYAGAKRHEGCCKRKSNKNNSFVNEENCKTAETSDELDLNSDTGELNSSCDSSAEINLNSDLDSENNVTSDLLSVNRQSKGANDISVKEESSNGENKETLSKLCVHCNKNFKSPLGLRRHENTCKGKPSVNNENNLSTEDRCKLGIEEEKDPLAENGDVASEKKDEKFDEDKIVNKNLCKCCGEDKATAHKEGDFECKTCSKRFRLKTSLERHIRFMHTTDNHECPQCGAKCPDKGTLARHMYTHTGLKPYSCPVCNQEFSRKYHVVRHNMQTGCDGKEKPVFPCQVCGREFNRKDNLREHLRAHAGQAKRKKKIKCDCCDVEFTGMTELRAHKKAQHAKMVGSMEKQYACEFCPKHFPSSGAMKKHRRTHTGERPYECGTCGKSFSAKETLNRHVRIHTGYKPHSCQYCGKSFIQSSQLKAHLHNHTGQSVLQPTETYVCDLCGKSFNRRTRLNEHIKYIHLGAKPFECMQCGKTFIRKEDINRHLIIHSGVKAHQCPICSKCFAMKSTLKVHLLTHTKEPPRSCDVCGRAFIRQDCLLRHMRNKHREMLEEIKSEAEKKKLQQQLLQVAAEASLVEGMEAREELDENGLVDAVRELLTLLVDETTLKGLGWPDAGVEALLEAVIKRCGHEPAPSSTPRHDRLRHNIKLLFTVVIDDSAVKALLNNQTVDEVILHVLRLAKS